MYSIPWRSDWLVALEFNVEPTRGSPFLPSSPWGFPLPPGTPPKVQPRIFSPLARIVFSNP